MNTAISFFFFSFFFLKIKVIKTQMEKKLALNGADEGQTQDGRSAHSTSCLHTQQRRGHMEENLLGC